MGAGVAWGVLIAEQQLKISVPWNQETVEVDFSTLDVVNNTGPNEDPANDVGFNFKASDWGGVSWNAGLMIEPPSQKWAFGLMVQPPVKFHAKGKMQADFSNHVLHTDGYLGDQIIVSEKVSDDDVTLNILMPLILKAGFAVRPTETSEIELAGVWQNWSRIETMTITGLNLVVDVNGDHMVPVARRDDTIIDDDVVLPTYYEDAWSVRLGGQNHFGAFTARAGAVLRDVCDPDLDPERLLGGRQQGRLRRGWQLSSERQLEHRPRPEPELLGRERRQRLGNRADRGGTAHR